MDIGFKKGQASDITVLYGSNIANSTVQLLELCKTNDITCERSHQLPASAMQFFINPVKVRKSTKKKKEVLSQPLPQQTPTLQKAQSKGMGSFSSILAKYSVSSTQTLTSPTAASKTNFDTQGLIPKLLLVHVQGSTVQDYLDSITSVMEQMEEPEYKHMFLLEGVKAVVKGKAYKSKRKKFAKENARITNTQMMIESDEELEDSAPEIESFEDFELTLMSLMGHTQWEYELSQTPQETLSLIQKTISIVVYSKYKAEAGEFDVRGQTHSSEASYFGVNDVYSLMWIDMLMSISGVSEMKALAIFNEYPTLKRLMEAYEAKTDEGSRQKMLAEIQVSKTFEASSKVRNLGKSLSSKIHAVFQYEKGQHLTSLMPDDDEEDDFL